MVSISNKACTQTNVAHYASSHHPASPFSMYMPILTFASVPKDLKACKAPGALKVVAVQFNFAFWGHTHQGLGVSPGSALRNHSSAQRTMWDAGGCTQVGCMNDNYFIFFLIVKDLWKKNIGPENSRPPQP